MKSRLSAKIIGIIVGMLVFGSLIAVHAEDTTPPSIISVTPTDNSVNVPLKTHPIIVFSEPVETSTFGGLINGFPILGIQTVFDASNQTVTLDLGEMEYETSYTVTISGSLEDTSGNPMGSNYTFSFSTATRISKRPTSTIVLPSVVDLGTTYNITGQATGYIWQEDTDNPLQLNYYDQTGVIIGDRPVYHPTALYFPNGENGYKFYLIYTPGGEADGENPCLMRSNDGENFTGSGVTNPILVYNTQPVYDSKCLADPDALKVGNAWMVFYALAQTNYAHIGVAFSSDGVHYTPYGGPYNPSRPMLPFPTDGNPIIHFSNDTPYEHDMDPNDVYPRVGEPAVIFKDSTFHMWYGSANTGRLEGVVYANASDPKGPWLKYGPVLYCAGHPDVVYDPERDLYVTIYLSQPDWQLNIATAPTPLGPWTNHPDNPVLEAEEGWEGSTLYRASMVQVGTQWYLYYTGGSDWIDTQIGLAREVPGCRKAEISTDGGVSWSLISVASNGNWSYLWTPPSKGIYSIKVRVTDDWMRGDPNEAIVTVVNPADDKNPPEWRNQGQSKSFVNQGGSVYLYAQARDQYGLKYAILSTNETGNWKDASWWNSSWLYRKGITITENSGSTLSGFQVKLNVAYVRQKMKPDFSDLRFIDGNQMITLPYWIESYTPSSSASVWVKVSAIPAFGATTIYMYYGNPSAVNSGSGSATMEFFDAFSGSSLDTIKWNVNAVNQIAYSVDNYLWITNAKSSSNTYWIYDGTDTGSQHQANWAPLSQFVIEFRSAFSDSPAVEIGEGMIGLVAADNTVIGAAGCSDWTFTDVLPWRSVVTENLASSMGAGVALNPWFPNAAFKNVSATDATHWTVAYNGSTLTFYDDGGFFAQSPVSSPVSKLAIIGGAYEYYPYLDYIQFSGLFVHKYASTDPTVTIDPEETPNEHGYSMGDVAETWVWSNFTWHNSSIPVGTVIAWRILYVDASGNWNSTDQMTFLVTLTGDVNGDGEVNSFDLSTLSNAYGSQPSTKNWNPNCDLNDDNKTDAKDLWTVGENYGQIVDLTGTIESKKPPILTLFPVLSLAIIRTSRKKEKACTRIAKSDQEYYILSSEGV